MTEDPAFKLELPNLETRICAVPYTTLLHAPATSAVMFLNDELTA